MPRTAALGELNERRRVRREAAGLVVEAELEHLVRAEMRHEGMAIRAIGHDGVCVPGGRNDLHRLADTTIGPYWIDADEVGTVRGPQEVAARAVEDDVRQALRQRRRTQGFQRTIATERIAVQLEWFGARRADQRALVRTHRQRTERFFRRRAAARFQRAVGTQLVDADRAFLRAGNVDE